MWLRSTELNKNVIPVQAIPILLKAILIPVPTFTSSNSESTQNNSVFSSVTYTLSDSDSNQGIVI